MKSDRVCHTEILGQLTDPPFYLPVFEEAYRFIIDDYRIPDKDVAIFIPCAIKKRIAPVPAIGCSGELSIVSFHPDNTISSFSAHVERCLKSWS